MRHASAAPMMPRQLRARSTERRELDVRQVGQRLEVRGVAHGPTNVTEPSGYASAIARSCSTSTRASRLPT